MKGDERLARIKAGLHKTAAHVMSLSHFVYFGAAALSAHDVYAIAAAVIFVALVVLAVIGSPEGV